MMKTSTCLGIIINLLFVLQATREVSSRVVRAIPDAAKVKVDDRAYIASCCHNPSCTERKKYCDTSLDLSGARVANGGDVPAEPSEYDPDSDLIVPKAARQGKKRLTSQVNNVKLKRKGNQGRIKSTKQFPKLRGGAQQTRFQHSITTKELPPLSRRPSRVSSTSKPKVRNKKRTTSTRSKVKWWLTTSNKMDSRYAVGRTTNYPNLPNTFEYNAFKNGKTNSNKRKGGRDPRPNNFEVIGVSPPYDPNRNKGRRTTSGDDEYYGEETESNTRRPPKGGKNATPEDYEYGDENANYDTDETDAPKSGGGSRTTMGKNMKPPKAAPGKAAPTDGDGEDEEDTGDGEDPEDPPENAKHKAVTGQKGSPAGSKGQAGGDDQQEDYDEADSEPPPKGKSKAKAEAAGAKAPAESKPSAPEKSAAPVASPGKPAPKPAKEEGDDSETPPSKGNSKTEAASASGAKAPPPPDSKPAKPPPAASSAPSKSADAADDEEEEYDDDPPPAKGKAPSPAAKPDSKPAGKPAPPAPSSKSDAEDNSDDEEDDGDSPPPPKGKDAAKPEAEAGPAAKPKAEVAPAGKPKDEAAPAAKPKDEAAPAAKPKAEAAPAPKPPPASESKAKPAAPPKSEDGAEDGADDKASEKKAATGPATPTVPLVGPNTPPPVTAAASKPILAPSEAGKDAAVFGITAKVVFSNTKVPSEYENYDLDKAHKEVAGLSATKPPFSVGSLFAGSFGIDAKVDVPPRTRRESPNDEAAARGAGGLVSMASEVLSKIGEGASGVVNLVGGVPDLAKNIGSKISAGASGVADLVGSVSGNIAGGLGNLLGPR